MPLSRVYIDQWFTKLIFYQESVKDHAPYSGRPRSKITNFYSYKIKSINKDKDSGVWYKPVDYRSLERTSVQSDPHRNR